MPPELAKAFAANKKAKKFFDTLSNTNRKYILYYINGAKLEATKAKRIAEIIAAANEGRMHDQIYHTIQASRRKKKSKLF